jgi:hypothetical protein
MKSERGILLVMGILIVFATRGFAQTIVNEFYKADASGKWRLYSNFTDINGDGFIDPGDSFPVARPTTPDPSVMRLGSYWYITGSDSEHNFRIWRTTDFQSFTLHMTAFHESQTGNAAGQRKGSGTNGMGQPDENNDYMEFYNPSTSATVSKFWRMWAPHLYTDPADNTSVYLAFTGIRWGYGDPYSIDFNTHPEEDQYHSCYVVKIAMADFVAPSNGVYFCDRRAGYIEPYWYGYSSGGDRYDGGYSVGRVIPCTGNFSLLGISPGQLWLRAVDAGGTLRGGFGRRNMGRNTVLSIDPFVFFDTNPAATSSPWARTLFANYLYREYQTSSTFSYWGNSICMVPLNADNRHLYFQTGNWYYDVKEIAFARNSRNQVDARPLGQPTGSSIRLNVDNGTVGAEPEEWFWGGVAEGASTFYNVNNGRYYTIYSRNCYDSTAYQVVYRMSEQGKANVHEALSINYGDSEVMERVLLRGTEYQQFAGANFGHPQVFSLTNPAASSQTYYYIALHVKPRGTMYPDLQQRVFIKELSFYPEDPLPSVVDPREGTIFPLREGSDWAGTSIGVYRLPLN